MTLIIKKMMETKTMTSTAIQNRSFLHGDIIGEKYATIESVALRRTSLPLQLIPTSINFIDENVDEGPDSNTTTPACSACPTSLKRQPTFKVYIIYQAT